VAGEGSWPACIPLAYSTHELAYSTHELAYSTHELGIRPEAYDPKLDAGFAPLREQDLTAASFGEAA